ncbi:MAG: hypothetical protein ACREO4_03450 [Lysobacter sp.]
MIDRIHKPKNIDPGEMEISANVQSLPNVLTDEELRSLEEALVLAHPTPGDDAAFREHLRKNGKGGGDS